MPRTDEPHRKGPTVRDVAKAAAVSVGTVSRVLNADETVRQPMRDAVLRAVRDLGYQPNAAARLLRARRTRVLGMISADLSHPMEVLAMRGAEAAVQECGYTLLLGDAQGDANLEARAIEGFVEQRVEGVLSAPIRSVRRIHEPLERAGIPLVLYGQWSRKPGVPTGVVDEAEATEEAIAHLVELGHRCVVTCGLTREPGRYRRAVLAQIVERRWHGEVELQHVHGTTTEAIEGGLRDALSRRPRPTAVMVLSHGPVADVLRVIRECGLWYTDDLSVVAFGDSVWATAIKPPLSVVAVDYREHTAAAARLLVDIVEGDRPPRSPGPVGLSHYIRRSSVAAPPGHTGR